MTPEAYVRALMGETGSHPQGLQLAGEVVPLPTAPHYQRLGPTPPGVTFFQIS